MVGWNQGLGMTNGNERIERIERVLEQVTDTLQRVTKSIEEVAVRQQYHDEAFERHDAEMKSIREAIAMDAENIRALARIAELHNRRLDDLEGGEAR
jgi:peptidoglycan hydrolase CwlO-like protein